MVRYTSFFIVCAFIALSVFKASHVSALDRDSLRASIDALKTEDKKKVDMLLVYANSYVDISSDSINVFSRKALKLAEQLNYARGKAVAIDILGTYYFSKGMYDSALAYHDRSLYLIRKGGFEKLFAATYNNIGNIYMRLAEYTEALTYYDSSLASGKKTNNREIEGRVLGNIAMVCYEVGNYSEALQYYLQGEEIYDEINYKLGRVANYTNLANVYFRLGDYDNALAYADSANKYSEIEGSDWSLVSSLTTYALIYNERKQYQKSLEKLQEALAIAHKMNMPYVINLLEGNIAECYLNMGEYDKSKELYLKTMKVSEQLQDLEGVGVAKAGFGKICVLRNKEREGISYLSDALAIMQQIRSKEQVKDIAQNLSTAYEKIGDYKNSLKYLQVYNLYADSLSKDIVLNKDRQLQFNYELAKKQDLIDQLEQNKTIDKVTSDRQKILLGASFVGFLLTLVIAYLIYRNLQNVQQGRSVILEKKNEIEHQAQKLAELNAFKDRTFSVLSHDLRSPINALTSTMMLFDEKLLTPEEFNEHKQELSNKLQSVSLLLDNLLQWAKSQMKGEQTLDIVKINMKRKVLRSFAVLKDMAQHKNIQLVNSISDDIIAYADMHQIAMVVRNLLSNAIKFTPEGGLVTVSAIMEGDETIVSVMDTGVGMTEEQIAKIFNNETNTSTAGTSGEKGTGVGLHLSYDFVKANGGEMIVESIKGKGTTFTVILPNTPNVKG